jgi:hypothetical protein
MSDYNIILILIGTAATLMFVVFVWNAFFWRSWGRVINMVMRLFVEGQDMVDPNKKIEPDMSESRADALKAKAQSIEDAPLNSMDFVPQQAVISEDEQQEFNQTTSDSGWPRALSEDERDDPRPFRNVHIGTDNEARSQTDD